MLKFTSHKFFSSVAVMLLGIAIALSLTGCRQKDTPISDSLLQIDSLLQSDPDSAYSLLVNVNFDSLPGERDKNFYRLLMVEAQDKTFRDDTVYKDISAAAEYFDSIGDRRNAMRSLFYQGRIFQNRHEYGNAIISMLKAEEKADSTEHLYLGKIYNAISEAYKEVSDAPQELKYARKALEEYEQLDSVPFVNDAKLWLGLSLCRNNMPKEGIALLSKIYTEACANGDEFTQVAALQNLSVGYLWINDYMKAKNCLSLLYSTRGNSAPKDYVDLYLCCLISTHSPNDSIETTMASVIEDMGKNNLPHQYYAHIRNYCKAYELINTDLKAIDSLFVNRLNSGVASAINMHLTQEKLNSNMKSEMLKERMKWMVISIFLGLAILTIFIYTYLLYKKNKENKLLYTMEILHKEKDNLLKSQNELSNIYQHLVKDNKDLIDHNKKLSSKTDALTNENDMLIKEREKIKLKNKNLIQEINLLKKEYTDYKQTSKTDDKSKLLENFFKELDSLHAEYYKAVTPEKSKSIIIRHISSQLKRIKEDNNLLAQMEGFIDSMYDNLIAEVYSDLKLNMEQRRIVVLSCLKFSKESICQIMGITLPNYYTRMNRILKRIEGIANLRKEELITCIRN